MGINITLIIQMLVFATFVWFTMKFVWPPLQKALEERETKIADGLAAADRGRRELELAHHRVRDELREARHKASEIIEKASVRASQIIEEAKEQARAEAEHAAKIAHEHLAQEVNRARDALRKEVGQLAVAGAQKILMQEIDQTRNALLLDHLIEEI